MPGAGPDLAELVEAVADGRATDLSSMDTSGLDEAQRARVTALRDIWEIGRCLTALTSTGAGVSASALGTGANPGAAPRLDVPTVWGTLSVREHVGHGRFGDVYRAWDLTLDREVALKVLRRDPGHPDQSQIVREGRLMARVRHPNVVTIYGAQRIEGRTGLWMEFIHGQTLAAELSARGRMDAAGLVSVGVELCAALGAVHAAGLVHRDVKAQNVMRQQGGRIVLGDFGTGQELDEAPVDGVVLAGTPAYLAPEIFEHQPATPQSDLYSLGALLFHLATGDYPVRGRTIAELRAAHRERTAATLRTLRPDLPALLTAAIDRALEPNPARRYACAADFSTALWPTRAPGPGRGRLASVGAALSLAALIVAGLLGVIWRAPAAAPASSLAPEVLVLVTAFDNRTGDPQMDGAVELAMEDALASSSQVRVVPRDRLADALGLMQRATDHRPDAVVGREVALRDGQISVIVAGRLEKMGTSHAVVADVRNAADGSTIASVREEARQPQDLMEAVQRAALRVRETLGDPVASIAAVRPSLERVSTRSFRALQLYSRALAATRGDEPRHEDAAVPLLEEALREDPGFASAHILLAEFIARPGRETDARAHVEQARAASARLSDVERRFISGKAHEIDARLRPIDDPGRTEALNRAAADHQAVLALQPDHYRALVALSTAYRWLNRVRDTLPLKIRLASLRPNNAAAQVNVALLALETDQLPLARQYADRARALRAPVTHLTPDQAARLALFDAYEAWMRDAPDVAMATLDRTAVEADALPTVEYRDQYRIHAASMYATLGRLLQADRAAQRIEDAGLAAFTRALIAAQREDRGRLSRFLAAHPETAARAPGVWVEAGLLGPARQVIGRNPLPHYQGYLALAEGRYDEATMHLRRALDVEWSSGFRIPRVSHRLSAALSATGARDEAIAVLEAASRQRGRAVALGGYEWLRVRAQLADRYRDMGRLAEAVAVEAQLLGLLSVADEDHPIRRRLLARAGAAGVSTHITRARGAVLVTAAVNRTGETVLDGTIEYALARELSQSPLVTVVPRPRVVDVLLLMKKPLDMPLDAATSREVALRDGSIRALVTGRVEKVGGVYGVSVDVVDPASGATLTSISEPPVPQAELLKAMGRAAIAVRGRLGESLESLEASRLELQRVTTPSLKALQLFSQAAAFLDGQGGALVHAQTSKQLLRAAIAEDPSFAAAHGLLSEAIRMQPGANLDEVLAHIEQAIVLSETVTDVERLRIEGSLAVKAQMTSDQAERRRWIEHGIAKNEAVVRLRPNNYEGLVILTNLYQQLGRPHARYAAQLSDMRPAAWEWATRASVAALWHGDVASARKYASRGARVPIPIAPVGATVGAASWLHLFDAWEAWLRNDVRSAASVADRLAAGFDTLPVHLRSEFALGLSRVNVMLGRLERADAFASRIADPQQRRGMQITIAQGREDYDLLRDILRREYPSLDRAPFPAMIAAGALDPARTALDRLNQQPGADSSFPRGLIALVEGRADEAVGAFEAYLERFIALDGHHVARRLAQALEARGDVAKAIALLERFSTQRVPVLRSNSWSGTEWLPLREQLAALYRQAGRHGDADVVDAELRALVAVADADHPVRRRLASSGGR